MSGKGHTVETSAEDFPSFPFSSLSSPSWQSGSARRAFTFHLLEMQISVSLFHGGKCVLTSNDDKRDFAKCWQIYWRIYQEACIVNKKDNYELVKRLSLIYLSTHFKYFNWMLFLIEI